LPSSASPRRPRSAASTRSLLISETLRTVTLYHAEGCHLCDRAIEVVREARVDTPFELELVDIGGNDALEAAYRAFLPVIEVDGVRAFTYFVSVETLLARLDAPADGSLDPGEDGAGNM
jgi:hypothetical protein